MILNDLKFGKLPQTHKNYNLWKFKDSNITERCNMFNDNFWYFLIVKVIHVD